MKRFSDLLLTTAVLLLAGCASVVAPTSPSSTGGITLPQESGQAAVVPPTQTPAQTSPVPGGEAVPGTEIPAVPEPPAVVVPPASGNRAVIALLDRAQLDADAGRPDAASASLERALRIEPRNARLWHELAQLRLAQGQYAQAISLAQKSNSFAGAQRQLQALNWRVIGEARIAQGNPDAGQKALSRAAALEQ